MQFLKQIKGKALGVSIFDKKQNIQQQKIQQKDKIANKKEQKQKGGYLNSINIKSMASSWFHKYKQQEQHTQPKNEQNKNIQQIAINGQARFWQTAPSQKQQQSKQKQQQRVETKQGAIQVDEQSAAQFISNLCKSSAQSEKQNKMKINKARNAIFGNLSMQPIYMTQNNQLKMLKMEFQCSQQLLIERTQILVLQMNNVDRAIESALISGYLWQAHGLPNKDIIEACYQTISKGSTSINQLSIRAADVRKKLQLFLNYFNKVNALNQKRIKIVKKLKLLAKIKQYSKQIGQKFQNLDQAFYIQRNRQKLHAHFVISQNLVSKVLLMQSLVNIIRKQNKKLTVLIQSELTRWIDNNEHFEKKHIQKLLILYYFVKNQKMYTKNGFQINLNMIRDKEKLIKQINEVKKWKDYKYVNDKTIKQNVTQFLDYIILQLQRGKAKSNLRQNDIQSKPKEKLRVTKKQQSKQQNIKGKNEQKTEIKF